MPAWTTLGGFREEAAITGFRVRSRESKPNRGHRLNKGMRSGKHSGKSLQKLCGPDQRCQLLRLTFLT